MNENNDIDDQEDQIDINQDVNEIIEEIVQLILRKMTTGMYRKRPMQT